MAELTARHVDASKRLFMSVSAAAMIMELELTKIFKMLRLGRGLFWKRMSSDIRATTHIETWAYLSALMVCMIEEWHDCPPPEGEIVIQSLEVTLIDCQRIDYRFQYDAYRERFNSGRNRSGVPDMRILGPMFGIHSEYTGRLVSVWQVPSVATVSPYAPDIARENAREKMSLFIHAMSDLQTKIEDGYKNGLKTVWPSS